MSNEKEKIDEIKKVDEKHSHSTEHEKTANKEVKNEISENKKPTEKEKKKEKTKPIIKKEFAIARGTSLHISKRHGMYICSFIKGKKIDDAIKGLEGVKKMKIAIPFKGEIPHRKGMMSGRYPVKSSGIIISVLKSLKGNSLVNGLDLDKTVIYEATSNWASRPMKTGSRRAKRTHIVLMAKEFVEASKK